MKKSFFLFVIILVFVIASCLAETLIVRYANKTATIKKIESKGDKLLITYEFENDGSSTACFTWSFSTHVYQGGVECSQRFFDSDNHNSGVNIKTGAKLEVVETFNLRDRTTMVEIEVESWPFALSSITVYFEPKTQKFGGKSIMGGAETEAPAATPVPTVADPDDGKTSIDVEKWICPSCGRVLTSKFCPECGINSPTPAPTPTPTLDPTWTCSSCGAKLTSKFCPDCGVTSPAPTSASSPAISNQTTDQYYEITYSTSADDYLYEESSQGITLLKYSGNADVVIVPDAINGKPVRVIGESCFESHKELLKVVLPDNMRTIKNNAFYNCSNMREFIMNEGLYEIGQSALAYTGLIEVRLPESVKKLGARCFYGCIKLTNVILSPYVWFVSEYTFSLCPALKTVTIPAENVTIISNAFEADDDVTLIGTPGSGLEDYAKSKGLNYETYIIGE